MLVLWDVNTGYKSDDAIFDNGEVQLTQFAPDGSVLRQLWRHEARFSPPWLWGVTDQTDPSAPAWILDDALWQTALDAQE